jgi:hypothetical protein
MTYLLRLVIIVIAGIELWYFSESFELSFEILTDPIGTRWFNFVDALGQAIIAPLLAIAAAVMGVVGRRLGLAGILLAIAAFVYVLWSLVFAIGVAIYGF